MSVVLAEGYQSDFGFVLEFVNEPTNSEEISMLSQILLNEEQSPLFE